MHVPEGRYLIADTAFPRGSASISGKIRAPLKGGDTVPPPGAEREHIMAFNRQLLSYRQTAEWGMRMLQGSFGRLRIPLPISSTSARVRLLENAVRLANVRTQKVGINQIRTVYMNIWRTSEDDRLWLDLGNVLFGDIRRRDRVSRYHLVIVDE